VTLILQAFFILILIFIAWLALTIALASILRIGMFAIRLSQKKIPRKGEESEHLVEPGADTG
jgi:uncharacterized membrane-anchored protein YhcB (DUF1043 family)